MNGTYRAFPTWTGLEPFVSRKLTVTHPLGGCPIGGSSTDGVVNAKGQVFNTMAGGQTVHPGLYVADRSIIPGPLAVKPTLTIVIDRTCESRLVSHSRSNTVVPQTAASRA